MHRAVIIGGGFGGLYAARALRHETALRNAGRPPQLSSVSAPVVPGSHGRVVAGRNRRAAASPAAQTKERPGAARRCRRSRCRGAPSDSGSRCDSLRHADRRRRARATSTSATTPGSPSRPGLKSLEDATRIRHKILYAFEAAERETDPERRRRWLTFVIVGAGPTGVELAGALAEIANDSLRHDFRSIHPEESRILLLDASPRVLTAFPESLSAAAERQLIRLGVRVIPSGPRDRDRRGWRDVLRRPRRHERIETHTVLWAAGVKPSPWGEILARRAGAELDRARPRESEPRSHHPRPSRNLRHRRPGVPRAGRRASCPASLRSPCRKGATRLR